MRGTKVLVITSAGSVWYGTLTGPWDSDANQVLLERAYALFAGERHPTIETVAKMATLPDRHEMPLVRRSRAIDGVMLVGVSHALTVSPGCQAWLENDAKHEGES